jgi:hypothetical protein
MLEAAGHVSRRGAVQAPRATGRITCVPAGTLSRQRESHTIDYDNFRAARVSHSCCCEGERLRSEVHFTTTFFSARS